MGANIHRTKFQLVIESSISCGGRWGFEAEPHPHLCAYWAEAEHLQRTHAFKVASVNLGVCKNRALAAYHGQAPQIRRLEGRGQLVAGHSKKTFVEAGTAKHHEFLTQFGASFCCIGS